MTQKPKCPTLDEVTESLKILGVTHDAIATLEEMVFDYLVASWKKNRRHVSITAMAREMKKQRSAVNSALMRLVDQDRVFRIQRGVYVPNMVKRRQQ